MEPLETGNAKHIRTEEGILISRVKENEYETLADARQNAAALMKLKGADATLPLLVDFSKASGQDAETRKFYAEESVKWTHRVALLVNSPVARVMGNIYMGLNKPLVPTRLFTDEKEALAWLKSN